MAHDQAVEKAIEDENNRDHKDSFPELKGAKLFWHVHSGSEITPSYVYNPREKVPDHGRKMAKKDADISMNDLDRA
jgi:hypothetical protein